MRKKLTWLPGGAEIMTDAAKRTMQCRERKVVEGHPKFSCHKN